MNKFKLALLSLMGVFAMNQIAAADSLEKIAPYPAAGSEQVRHVITLPALEDENAAKVELIIGKELEVDCNNHFFGGALEEKTLQGWGYTYLVLDELKGPFGTLMACQDNTLTKKFVVINSTQLHRYNSKLPIVIYTPKGVEVKYRVWQPSADVKKAVIK